MRKDVFAVLSAVIILLTGAVKSYAVDFILGATGSYNYWQPCFRDLVDDYKGDPFFMYGPVLSLGFEKIKFTAMLNASTGGSCGPEPESGIKIKGTGTQGDYTFSAELEPERIEIDLNISYGISERLSLFAGYKFLMFNLREPEGDIKVEVTPPYTLENAENFEGGTAINLKSYAIGSGVNYSYTINNAFSLTPGISLNISKAFIYELVYLEESSPGVLSIMPEDLPGGESEYEYTGVGTNMNLTLAYYFDLINTSLSLGARLQATHFIPHGDAPDMATDYMSGIYAFFMLYF